MNADTKISIVRAIGARQVGEELFLLSPTGDLVIIKNETAKVIWEQLSKGPISVAELTDSILVIFEVDRDTAEKDIRAFMTALAGAGIVNLS